MASASTPSATKQAEDINLVHSVQLKPIIKAQISGRMISSGINYVAIASVYFEKTCLKEFIMIIIITTSNRKNHLLVNKKGDVGMAKL